MQFTEYISVSSSPIFKAINNQILLSTEPAVKPHALQRAISIKSAEPNIQANHVRSMSYTGTTRYTYTQKPIIHSRDSSIDSRDSYENRSSTYYTTTSTTMANGDYKKDRSEKRRVPDNPDHYIRTITSSNGNQVHIHDARRYDHQEPRSSQDTYQYQNQQRREDREYYSSRR
ncbi:hypothetical protein BDZ45DRAFT_489554 [Acephala macrosclerotiorum]|nr:hypothetical protein BDZ45DRAFT_489554 [Acephala macrosclerotiorum]